MTVAAAPAPSMFAVFRSRDFRLIWLAQLISTAGSSLTDLAAAIWVYRETGSALAVGLTLIATAVPSLIVGLLAGVYVDRHDRKKIMVWTCLIQAVIVGFIALTVEMESIVGLYALILLNAGVKQFFDPAYESLIPEMATDEELTAANAFLSIASFGSTAIGFAGAGLLASTIGLTWAFLLDALSFLVCAGLLSFLGRYTMPVPDDDASVKVIVANLKVGMVTLFTTPIIRSLFIVGAFMFVAFGLWNVLLLPFSITEPPQGLGATEFEYGLQEGLTSVGFVIGSLLMARFSRLLPEPAWIVLSLAVMGVLGLLYATSTSVPMAILWVSLSGLAQPPSSVSRSVLLQRNTPREMRGRVFSAFYVMRDVIFLIGMAGAGLADVVDIRLLIVFASCLLFVSAAFTLVAPGLGVSTWGAAAARLRGAEGPGLAAIPSRPATLADFDRLAVRLGVFGALTLDQRMAFVHEATVRDVPAETKILEHGDESMSAFFILDGSTTAGIPSDDGYHGLSTMTAGDFFGEIGALTGSTRSADVVADVDSTLLEVPADALRATMSVPEIQRTVMSTMSSRLQRTDAADLPRLAGVGQAELRDLRTPRPSVESLPKSYDASAGGG